MKTLDAYFGGLTAQNFESVCDNIMILLSEEQLDIEDEIGTALETILPKGVGYPREAALIVRLVKTISNTYPLFRKHFCDLVLNNWDEEGNVGLIVPSFRVKLIHERIVHRCIQHMLSAERRPKENISTDVFEQVVVLLRGTGLKLDRPAAKKWIDQYFLYLRYYVIANGIPAMKYMLADLEKLREDGWDPTKQTDREKKRRRRASENYAGTCTVAPAVYSRAHRWFRVWSRSWILSVTRQQLFSSGCFMAYGVSTLSFQEG